MSDYAVTILFEDLDSDRGAEIAVKIQEFLDSIGEVAIVQGSPISDVLPDPEPEDDDRGGALDWNDEPYEPEFEYDDLDGEELD